MKIEDVIVIDDADNVVIQPEKQEDHKIGSNTSAKDDAHAVVVKTERVDEPGSKQQNRPPIIIAQVKPSISNECISQAAKCFKQFGKRIFTVVPANQIPTAPDAAINQNAPQHIIDVDMDQEMVPDSITPNANSGVLVSNDTIFNRAEIVNAVMSDHQYAKPQASTDLVGDSPVGVEVSVEIELTDTVELTEKRSNSHKLIDLSSDQEALADSTIDNGQSVDDDDDDVQVQPITRPQNVYNTRAGGIFKAGRWQMLTENSSTVCEDLECRVCINYPSTNEKPHKCTTCAKQFVRKGDLARHMKTHENQFRCSICHIGLPDANSCQSHKFHCKFTRFECYLCKKYFRDNGEMLEHLKRIHIGKQLRRSKRPTRFCSKFSFDFGKFFF